MSEPLLSLRRAGRGRPVVFLGGCPTPWDVMSPFAAALTTTHECIEIALPGYGASAPLAAPYTLDAARRALEATLIDAGVTACSVVGFSAGAYRALALALGGRVTVERIFCLAGVGGLTADEATGFRQFAAALRAGQSLRALAGPRFLSAAFGAAHPEAVSAVEAWLDAAPAEVIAGELDAFADAPGLLPLLGELRVPVVARVGSLDVTTPPAKSEAIARAAKRGTLEIVPGAGHALMYEDLEGTTASVLKALAQ